MKKKTKNILIGAVFIVVLLVSIMAFGGFNNLFSITDSSGDMQIDSITKTTINGEDAIRITVTAIKGGEQLSINFDSTKLNQALAENDITDLKATKSLIATMSYDEESRFYGYRQLTSSEGGQVIYRSMRTGEYSFSSCSYENCNKIIKPGEDILEYRRFSRWNDVLGTCVCLFGSNKATAGTFTDTSIGNYKVTFSIPGLNTVQLSRDKLSASLGNGNTIKWNGNKLGLDNFNIGNEELFIYNTNLYMQEVGTKNSIDSINDKIRGYFTSSASVSCSDFETWNTCFSRLTSNHNSDVNSKWSNSFFTTWKNLYANSLDNAVLGSSGLTVYFKEPTNYPTFIIDLKAKDVGIIKLSGMPSINCPSSCTFRSNEVGSTNLVIKNVATTTGYFSLSFDNCNILSANSFGSNQLGQFNSGQSKTISINVQGQTGTSSTTGTCSVSVYDINVPSNKDTCNLKCTISPNIGGQCNEGSTKCDSGYLSILKCQNGEWVNSVQCTNGKCKYDENSNALCYSPSECKKDGIGCATNSECCENLICDSKTNTCISSGVCKWYDLKCWWNKIFGTIGLILTIVKWILLVVVSLVSLFFSKDFISGFFKKQDKITKAILWISGILIGIGMALLLYILLLTWIFWAVLIGAIILFSILKFIPRFK
ncbi:MAG: hypothetical protein KKC77_19405 [Proteobacteria bacterium]|nr:hypothetical protein [Pseudomonadota bacterium]